MISDGFRVMFLSSLLHVLSDNVPTASLRPAGPASWGPGAFGYLSGLPLAATMPTLLPAPTRKRPGSPRDDFAPERYRPPEKSARGFLANSENADVNSEVNSEVNFEVNFR